MSRYKLPPENDNDLVPSDLLSESEEDLITRHYEALHRLYPDEFGKKAERMFSGDERAIVASLYEKMRDNGFFPAGIDDAGRIRWGILLKSKVRLLYERTMPDLPERPTRKQRQEMMDYCRSSFVKFSEEHEMQEETAW